MVKKTVAWRQINSNPDPSKAFGFVEVAGQYSKAIDEAGAKTENFINKQKQAVSHLKNTLLQISSSAMDTNAPKAVKTESNREMISGQVAKVNSALDSLRATNTNTFTDGKIAVEQEIATLKVLIQELQRAESTATSLRAKPIEVVRDETLQKVSGLASDVKKVGIESDSLNQKIESMSNTLNKGAFDTADVNNVLNTYAVAKTELIALKKEQAAYNAELNAASKITGLNEVINSFEKSNPDVKEFTVDIGNAKVSLDSMRTSLQNVSTTAGVNVVTQQFKAFEVAARNAGLIINETISDASKIQYAIDVGKPKTQLEELRAQYHRLGITSDDVADTIQKVEAALKSLSSKGQSETDLIENQNKFNQALDLSKNKVKQLSLDVHSINPEKGMHFSNQMKMWLQKNSAAAKMCGKEVEYLIRECKNCDAVTLQRLKDQFISVQNKAREAGKLGKSFSESIKSAASSFTQWVSVTSVIMQGVQTARSMVKAVYDVNTAMIELTKVSSASSTEIANYFSKAAYNAKKLGASISDVINATADWSRLGYNLPDSEELAKVAVLYKNVGDGIDIDKANKSIVSTLQGFQMQAKDAIQIVDKFNEVDILAS